MINKEFDVVVFGATSFVGKIVCEYLASEYTEPNLSWAMAARSTTKLEALKASLGEDAEGISCITADSNDEASLLAMCERSSVIISTVGPYALYGDLLVKACVATGTDYCDLTGEPQWIKRMLDQHEAQSKQSGARIVHSCGFDSIPSDLGVKFLQDESQQRFGSYCEIVKMRVKAMQGGASGGTIASGVNLYKEAAGNQQLQRELRDPYSICGKEFSNRIAQHNVKTEFDEDFDSWAGPFVMASINTRIVFRSNAISDQLWGEQFQYDEAMLTGSGKQGQKRAKRLAFGTGMMMGALALSPIRWIAEKFILPKPGTGPSKEKQLSGSYDLLFLGTTKEEEKIATRVTGDRDPGYGSTAKMLTQAAISLVRDVDKNSRPGGFWTPATVFDEKLIERLRKHAGMSFEVVNLQES